MNKEVFEALLGMCEYELMDGAQMHFVQRKFNSEEYATIKGVIAYIENALHTPSTIKRAEQYAETGILPERPKTEKEVWEKEMQERVKIYERVTK